MIKKLIILLFLTLFLINSVSATDNAYFEPTTINPSYDSGYVFQLASNNVTSGNSFAVDINPLGSIITANNRMTNGTNILSVLSSRTTATSGITRIFGTSEDGSVWYFDDNLVDYSLGFYTLSPVTFTCGGAGGNCNEIYKIGTLTATTLLNRKIAEDSSGNIYINDATTIYRFEKSSGYAPSLFYTIVSGQDYAPATAAGSPTLYRDIIDMQFDSSNNLHILIGTGATAIFTVDAYLSKSVVSSSGTFIMAAKGIDYIERASGGTSVSANIRTGGLILDSTNPYYNYTFVGLGCSAYNPGGLCDTGTPVIKHNSTAGTTTVATGTGLTSTGGLGYYAGKIFISSWNDDLIRSYATTFTGQTLASDFIGVPEITYTTKTITSLDSTYYNKSDIYLEYNIIINSLDVDNLGFLSDFSDYRWSIALTDPNGVSQTIVQSPKCMYDGILDSTCQISSTMGITAPPNGWLAGSWTAKLYEINIVTQNRALIATSSAFTVLNTSLENQSIAPPPFEPITSGTAATTISKIDDMLNFFGFGVNAVSKLLFSMVIIAIFLIVGLIYGKPDIAMVLAFVPYAFFTFIEYIPKWIFIILIILLAIYSKVFR